MTSEKTHHAITWGRPRRRTPWGTAFALTVVVLLAGCGQSTFECSETSQCIDESGSTGICQPTNRCSFADSSCASGQRYAELSGELGGSCVDEAESVSYLGSVSAQALEASSLEVDLTGLPGADAEHDRVLLLTQSSRAHESILSVGTDLVWKRLREQCSARHITGVEGWWTDSDEQSVSVSWAGDSASTIVMISAFQVPTGSASIQVIGSSNTTGEQGACPGTGTDGTDFAVTLAPRTGNGVVVVSVARRHLTATGEPDSITLATASVEGVANGDVSGLTLIEYPPVTIADDVASGYLSVANDWAMLALEIL